MNPHARPPPHKVTWAAFVVMLLFAAAFIVATPNRLPTHLAVHFDAGGGPLCSPGLMCFVHWLVLDANRQMPPALSNQAFFIGLLAFFGCMVAWLGTLLITFRRP